MTLLTSGPTSAAVNAGLPRQPLPAQEVEPVPDPPAFDLEKELAQLEEETKVRLFQHICILACNPCAPMDACLEG